MCSKYSTGPYVKIDVILNLKNGSFEICSSKSILFLFCNIYEGIHLYHIDLKIVRT